MQHVPHESPDGRRRAHSPLCSGAFATGGGVSAHRHCPQARHHDVGGLERGRASELLRHADCGWTHAPCVRQPGAETHVHVRPHPQQRPQENWLVPLLPVWAVVAVCAVVIFRFRTALFTARPSIQQNCLRYHILLCVCVCMCTRVCVCLSGQSICSLAGQLGTFPRRVQSHFLNCFRDAYPSVRSSAARAAGSLSALPYAVEAALYAAVSKDENAKVRLDAVNGEHTIVVMMMVMMVMVTWMSLILHLVVCLRLCGPGLSIALRRLHVDTPKHQGLLVWIVSCSLSENACQALSGCYNTNHTLACTRSGTCCRQIRYEGQPALVQAACRSVVELGLNANADVRSAVIWRCALACPVTHCPLVRSVPLPVCVFIPSCLAHTSQASVLPSSLFATTANLAAGCAGLPMRRRMRLRASQTNAAKPWDGQRGMTLRASSLLASKQP